ncbi:MAG: DUF2235 domain-containing protein [Pseudomonadota bacterium]
MAKNIILCSDGTGNSGGKGNGTNVWRIHTSTDLIGFKERKHPTEQVTFYDDGVGTEQWKLLKVLGGGSGLGLSRNVRQLYADLVQNFEPGDHIFLFGFSRGAFTVRTLGGMITTCGILDKNRFKDDEELRRCIKHLFRAYRRSYAAMLTQPWYKLESMLGIHRKTVDYFQQEYGVMLLPEHYAEYENIDPSFRDIKGIVPIKFVGVWDTVDAVGLPIDEIANFWNKYIYQFKFPSHVLSPWVNKACHALAIDDERRSFHPLLFDEREEKGFNRIEQVWFPGVHSNVDGGSPKQGLAHVPLNWMIARAEEQGMVFTEDAKKTFKSTANENAKLYDSRSGVGVFYRYAPRDIAQMCQDNGLKSVNIHIAAFKRIALRSENYAPGQVPAFEPAVDDEANIGESPDDQQKLKQMVTQGLTEFAAEYDQSGLVSKRKILHRWFSIATLVLLGVGAMLGGDGAAAQPPGGVGLVLMKTLQFITSMIPFGNSIFETFLRPLFQFPLLGFVVFMIPVLLYLVDFFLKRELGRRYQEVWRKTIKGPWW